MSSPAPALSPAQQNERNLSYFWSLLQGQKVSFTHAGVSKAGIFKDFVDSLNVAILVTVRPPRLACGEKDMDYPSRLVTGCPRVADREQSSVHLGASNLSFCTAIPRLPPLAPPRSLEPLPFLFHHPQKPRDLESADCSETIFPFADLSEFTAADLSDSTEAAARRADGGAAFTDGEIAARNRSLEGRDLSGVQASWLGGGDSGSA